MNTEHNTQIIEIDSTNHLSTETHQQPPAQQQSSPGRKQADTDVRDLLKTLIERKWFIIALTLLGAFISLIVTLSMVPLYRAEAIIKIDPEKNKVLEFDVSTSGGATKTEQYFKTQLKLLKSKALAKKVIDNLELNSLQTDQEQEIEKPFFADLMGKLEDTLQGKETTESTSTIPMSEDPIISSLEQTFLSRLHIDAVGKSYLVNVAFDSEDPELAAIIVNSLIQNFIDSNLDSRLDSASHAKVFLAEKIEQAKAKLQEAEHTMLQFEKEKGIVTTGSRSLFEQKVGKLSDAYTRATQERIAAEATYAESLQATKKAAALTNSTIKSLTNQLKQLNKSYQENLKIYKPAYPLMRDIQYKIDQVKEAINEERQSLRRGNSINNSTNHAETKLKIARNNEASLKEELENAKTEALQARENSIQYDSLKHEVDSHRSLYESLLKRQKEVGVAGGVDDNNIAVIDPAVAPFNKHTPNTQLNIVLGTLLGFFSASLIALILGHKDERIKSVEDIAKVSDLPILGIFPFVKNAGKKLRSLLMSNSPSSMVSEAFLSLRTNLQFSTANGIPKIIHITSSEPGEGKSTTAINLATVFAQTNQSVLLIDADLRKPSIHKYLHIEPTISLGKALLQGKSLDEISHKTPIPNLTVIAGEAVESTPADLLSSNEMLNLLDKATDIYDLVIIDSPPVMGLADSLVLANRSTATLFVVASHISTFSQLETAIKRVQMGFGNIVGFVFTKAKDVKSSGYSYSYGGEHLKKAS